VKRWLAFALTSAFVAAAPAAGARAPSLTIVHRTPLVVKGVAFRPRESVTVTTPAGRMHVRTTANGSFLASFGAGLSDRCSGGARIVAVSVAGERVVLRLPLTMCAPAASP
jgi:hypothetical protein